MSKSDFASFGELSADQAGRVVHSCPPDLLPELLHQAIIAERVDLVQLVLQRPDLDLEFVRPDGGTALHLAVEFYQPEMVRLLCASGANLNAQQAGGWTPLHLAVDIEADSAFQAGQQPSAPLIRLLLEAGADRSLRDSDGNTAEDLAAEWEHNTAQQLLARR